MHDIYFEVIITFCSSFSMECKLGIIEGLKIYGGLAKKMIVKEKLSSDYSAKE